MKKKKIISLMIFSMLTSCVSFNNINFTNSDEIIIKHISDKKGAEINFVIKDSKRLFNAKSNSDGFNFKTSSDVQNYLVYLIKNASLTGYPSGGDPLGDIVGGPILITNNGATTKKIRFSNVPSSNGGAFYIAVRALGANNTDIIKDNNASVIPWSGATLKTNPRIAVSSGNGVIVDNSYQVNSTDPLSVTINLLDQEYASIKASFTVRNGTAGTMATSTVSPIFFINTMAGTSNGFFGDGGQASLAKLNRPQAITTDSVGNIYIADRDNHRIRKIDKDGVITTIAGSGSTGLGLGSYSGDNGFATSATLNSPTGVALDSVGNIYIADKSNHRIRKVTVSTGIISTFAGTGSSGTGTDNVQATDSTLNNPTGVEVDINGNVYIADYSNHKIRKVNTSGIITTFAGTGSSGIGTDNVQATDSTLNSPYNVYASKNGLVYIVDYLNHKIRKIDLSGVITTIAGNGLSGSGTDNVQATSSRLNFPTSIDFDGVGNMYIADYSNHKIRKVSTSGVITTFAGNGTSGSLGDGDKATLANLSSPSSVTLDLLGNFYVSDFGNEKIRKIYKD